MKRMLAVVTVLLVCFILLPSTSSAQSKSDGQRLCKEAYELQEKARSRQDLEKALQKYQQALKIFEKLRAEKNRGAVLNQIGKIHNDLGLPQKALEYYEKSLSIRQKLGDVKGEGTTLSNIGGVYRKWCQYEKALKYYERSLAVDEKLGDVEGEGIVLNNIALVYSDLGQYEKALEYSEKSLTISQKLGDVKGEGIKLGNRGDIYVKLHQYEKALPCHEKALAISLKLGDLRGEQVSRNNIGGVYQDWGQYQKALQYYEKVLAISLKLGDLKGEGVIQNNIGTLYRAWGQYQKALEYYEKSLAIDQKIGNVGAQAVTLANMGSLLENLGEHEKAMDKYRATLAIQEKINVPTDGVKDLIGNLYLDTSQIEKAEPFIKEAGYNSSLGRLYLLRGIYQSAVGYYEKALAPAQKSRRANSLFQAHTGLALAQEGLKQYEKAAEHFKSAIDLTEQMRDGLNEAQRANFYDVRVFCFARITPYEGLCRVLIQMGKPQESLKFAEATRARVFSELLSSRAQDASLDVPKSVLEKDAQITNRLAAMVQGLHNAYEKGSQDAIQSFQKQAKELRAQRGAHVSKLRKEYPLFAATKYPQPMDLSESALKDNEWVLEYEVTDSGVAIYLLKGKQIVKALFKPVPRKELDSLVRKLRDPLEVVPGKDNVADKLKAFDFTSGKKLADLLLGDVLSELPAGTPVIIVPDDSLGVVPFEMLVLNSGGVIRADQKIPYTSGAEFFGDRNPVSYYQSITALTLARTLGKKTQPGEKLLVMADPVYQMKDQRAQRASSTKVTSGTERFYSDLMIAMEESTGGGIRFDRLPLTGDLAEGLKGLFSGKTSLYTGLDASKELFLKKIAPELGQYRSVVFATHGYFGTRIPGILEPVLILTTVPHGTDGFLRMSEVMGCHMSADVVALTACQSGLGRSVSGEGTMGMGRAFQYAGAKSVLMSLWSVSEKSSVQMVESFFKHLKEGKGKLEALKLARDGIRNEGFDHPFFWAPFILVGEVN